MATCKILNYNLGYGLGLKGSVQEYIFNFHRYVRRPPDVRLRALTGLRDVLRREQPDLCCLSEVDDDLVTSLKDMVDAEYPHTDVENKYGIESVLRKLPVFSDSGNAFLSRQPLPFSKHYLKTGTKRLVYEMQPRANVHVFAGHFSLTKHTRRQQFRELKELTERHSNVVVCGDFNIFHGFDELKELIQQTGLRLLNSEREYTYPTHRPNRTLDLFLCSPHLKVKRFDILKDVHSSDHLPVLLELDL